MQKPIIITENDYRELQEAYGGFCLACKQKAYGIEPDARNYNCESCGAEEVFGLEELLIMGNISFKDEEDESDQTS